MAFLDHIAVQKATVLDLDDPISYPWGQLLSIAGRNVNVYTRRRLVSWTEELIKQASEKYPKPSRYVC